MKKINIVHLYPKEMNIYGDNGNILVLQQRLKWRGYQANVIKVGVGDKLPTDSHIIVGGGGQDKGQQIIAEDLQKKANNLADMANNLVPMLVICGMYQMFGRLFKTQRNEIIKGIGILDVETVAEPGRLIGNITVDTQWGELIGYENHSGRTYLDPSVKALGLTKPAQGNNGKDYTEGACVNNVFGSYLHGPLLAKSPAFADHILKASLNLTGINEAIKPLDDKLEHFAAQVAKTRPR
jgi:CobQ-like glutamine amidotransferase family enzyme